MRDLLYKRERTALNERFVVLFEREREREREVVSSLISVSF